MSGGPTIDTERVCRALEGVGQKVADVADAIDELIADLDLRLDEQTELLSEQVELLGEIAQTLRSPARTRAAERIRDAAELLRHHRHGRALAVAEQAIEDDPNNDVAFMLAAWASLGLNDLQRAQGYFREAAQATATTRDAEKRHMNAVFLAARLTFALDGPEAALRELDAADPFIDPAVRREFQGAREQLCLTCLDANKAGAIKFDRTVYYTASNQFDAALVTFYDVIEEHDARFCLMVFTDPVLAASEEILDAAEEALTIHRDLVAQIQAMLPLADARWRALWSEIQQHEIWNADTTAARKRFGELLAPGSGRRRSVEAKLRRYPNRRWLAKLAEIPGELDSLEARLRPFVEHERTREVALQAGIEDYLQRHRKDLLVDYRRTVAVVGRLAIVGGYKFQQISVDDDGEISVTRQEPTEELIAKHDEQAGLV